MTVQTAPARRPSGGPVKSPLAAHSHGTTVIARTQIDTPGTLKSPRDASIADFSDYLRTTNNRNGRPLPLPHPGPLSSDHRKKSTGGWHISPRSTNFSDQSQPS